MSVISIKGLTKTYGKSRGITDVNLEVEEGDIYGFIGPNGAGKSTTVKLLLNMIFPSTGSASIFSMDVIRESAKIKSLTGYVPGEVRYYENMTALKLLEATLSFHKIQSRDELERLCEIFEIEKNKKLGEMSLGNKKKVAIAAALVHEPKLILLDEPTSGLDPLMQKRLFELLKEKNTNGLTVFLSSHNLNEVQECCTKVAFIKEGNIIEIQELSHEFKRSKIITIDGNPSMAELEAIGTHFIKQEGTAVSYLYDGDINKLIGTLANADIKDITIENTSLESKFLSYYDGGNEK